MIVPPEAELLLALIVLQLLELTELVQLIGLTWLQGLVRLSGIGAIYMFHNSSGLDRMDQLQKTGSSISGPAAMFSFVSWGCQGGKQNLSREPTQFCFGSS